MSSLREVSYGEIKRSMHKHVGYSVSKEVFASHTELIWNLWNYLNLNFCALSADSSDEANASERRLKNIVRVLIEFINQTTSNHNARLSQHGRTVKDTVSLSNTTWLG